MSNEVSLCVCPHHKAIPQLLLLLLLLQSLNDGLHSVGALWVPYLQVRHQSRGITQQLEPVDRSK